jgi:alkanesulfonate monooxygenase
MGFPAAIRLITTCPQSKDVPREDYLARVEQVSRWSDDAGAHGMLVYTDNSIADPWLVAQTALRATQSLSPLIAVQPLYIHPCWAAKMVATLALLNGRRVDINMVAGGFRTDLLSLGDDLEHDRRYERVVEYAEVMAIALGADGPFSYQGEFFRVENARLRPSLPPELMPGFFVSGSSAGGLDAARRLRATAVKYPQPARDEPIPAPDDDLSIGIRLGVIARETDEQAWDDAVRRFPPDRRGQITHRLAMSVTDSHWHRQLAARVDGADPSVDAYWLWPFQNYRTFCPYLVGSYERVGVELAAYLERGFRTFILDIPETPDDLMHAGAAFSAALQGATP